MQTGATALKAACERGYKEIAELLLSAKTNVNHQDNVSPTVIIGKL